MVEAARRRSRLHSLAKSLNPLKARQPTLKEPEINAAAQELPTVAEDRLATIRNGSESSPFSYETPSSVAAIFGVYLDSICPACQNLGQEVWDEEYRKQNKLVEHARHLMAADDVYLTATQGCSGCQVIAWALEPFMKHADGAGKKVRICFDKWYYPVTGGITFQKLEFYRGSLPVEEIFTEIAIKYVACEYKLGPSCPWQWLKSIPAISSNTGSPAAIEKVKVWYSQCRGNHEQCHQDPTSRLPTRIIHIKGPNQARLYTSRGEVADYVCLSHSWGGQDVMQTTTQTLERYTAHLPWEELPKTFQYAIQFAHGLGFKYLWIDSLCIMQDSVDDWRHEGSRMAQIYANACITLSATWASDPDQGCFTIPDKRYVSRTKDFLHGYYGSYTLHCHELLPRLDAPLQRRGWVFQERMLSRRIVHFMEQELWWECRTSFLCECGNHNNMNLGIGMDWTAKVASISSPEKNQLYWEYIVQIYTMKSLTYPSDIFPALQGLAKLFSPIMGRYLAGLWELTLVRGLCWSPVRALPPPDQWRAPSWSWAAAQGAVRWPQNKQTGRQSCVAIVNVTTIPKGDDPMGHISYGAIVIRGNILAGKSKTTASGSHVDYELLLDESEDRFPFMSISFDPDCNDISRTGNGAPLAALRVSANDHSYGSGDDFWLVLRPTQSVEGEYVRIGTIRYAWGENRPGLVNLRARFAEEAVEREVKII